MADRSHDSREAVDPTAFVSPYYYIVGVGETIDDVQVTGEWVAIDSPVEVNR
jgi:hypothetical protein